MVNIGSSRNHRVRLCLTIIPNSFFKIHGRWHLNRDDHYPIVLQTSISSGPLKGMNSIIMAIRRAGRGYQNAETFEMAIMFVCGGLNLMP